MKNTPWLRLSLLCIFFILCAKQVAARELSQNERDARIRQLERSVRELSEQLRLLQAEQAKEKGKESDKTEALADLTARVDEISSLQAFDSESWLNKFQFGGYGEFHANFEEGPSEDQFDIHRLVLYIGYDFNDWIKFHSETEIEHAFVSDGSGGELVIEQAYFDFLLSELVNVRAGRVLTPLGIITHFRQFEKLSSFSSRVCSDRNRLWHYAFPWSSKGVTRLGTRTPAARNTS